MPGLLERAKVVVLKKGGARGAPSSPDETPIDDSGISPDERSELLFQIEGLFTGRRPIAIAEQRKARSGARFPLFVNLIAIAILAGAVFATARYSNNALRGSTSGDANYLTTEGLVVQRVKQQAAEQVGATEARIAAIKKELDLLRSGSSARSGASTTAREKQLANELTTLQSSTNNRLAALQSQQQQQLFFVRQLQAIYQNVGTQVTTGNVARALDGVDSADKLLREKALGTGGELAAIAPALTAGNSVLRAALMYGQSAAEAMRAASSSDTASKIAAISELVRQGDERYAAGDLAQAQTDYTKAIETLSGVSKAYNRLTEMSTAASSRQTGKLTDQIDRLEKHVAELQTTVNRQSATIAQQRSTIGSQRSALDQEQRQASQRDALLAAQRRQIEDEKVALQKRTEELSSVVSAVQRSVQPSGGSGGSDGQPDSSELVKLLKTKVEIRSLAERPEARRAYPGLSRYLDTFFQKYAEVYAHQGSAAALNQVASALNDVIVTLNLKLQANGIAPRSSPTGTLDRSSGSVSATDPVTSYLGLINGALAGVSTPGTGG